MRIKIVSIGVFFILFAIPSYNAVPSLITNEMDKLSGGNGPSVMSDQILSQLGIPPIDKIVTFIQYSFIGAIVAGFGILVFGMVAKKIPKQPVTKIPMEFTTRLEEEENVNLRAIHLLQERLAKGEITSSQYQNLKKTLEDKT